MAILVGLDPGSLRLGYGVVESRGGAISHRAHGTLVAPQSWPLPKRLAKLYAELCEVLDLHGPEAVGVEQVFTHRNPKTALVLGQARGIILLAAGQRELECQEFAPTEVKLAVCGNGRSGKDQVARMVATLLGVTLGAKEPEDSSDALAVALCLAHARGKDRILARAAAAGPRRQP